ncbi:MAG: RHS repeat-associated core domain-containing protein, partial [Gemmatimonadaceae bacterium]
MTQFLRNEFSDHAGMLPQLVQTTEKNAAPVRSTAQHDTAGNVIHAETGNLRFEQKFDQAGNATEVKDPNRPATAMSYDGRGALREEKLPDATTHQYRYSENAALDSYIDPAVEPGVRVESDLLGRPLRRIYADQTVEIFSWSGPRIDTFTDRQGRGRRFLFNTKGQLERIDAVAGATLEKLEYDDAGRLVVWTNAHARMTFADFDLEGRARKTSTTIFSDGSGLSAATGGIEYSQTHSFNVHGERSEWAMPRTATFQTTEPWTDAIRQRFDAMGNVIAIDRRLFGATDFKPLLTADYRNAGRPVARTVNTECGAGCAPSSIRRSYTYSDSTLQQSSMSVSADSDPAIAGSAITHDGLQIATTQLLGISSGERSTQFVYDTRSRVKEVVAGRRTEEKLSPADFRNEAKREPRIPENIRGQLEARGVNVAAIDPPSVIATEAPGHKVQSITRGAVTRGFTYSGAERTGDGRFVYEWDIFGRLIRATEAGNPVTRMRVSYGYDPNGRMVTRKVEMAQSGAPNNWIPPAPNLITDGLPAETHFLWDPITDTIAAVVHPSNGSIVRQTIHAENSYDDPIEVTLRQPATSTPPLARLYPIFDEAATGNLQAVINQRGEVVSRAMIGDAYGDDRSTLTGAAIDRIRMTAKKDPSGALEGVRIEFHSTERVDPSTVASGARLRAKTREEANIALTNLPPARVSPADAFTIELAFTRAQWEALATTEGLATLHPGITNALRSTSFGAEVPYLPPPDWIPLTQTVSTTADAPIEARTTLAYLSQWLASIPASTDRTLPLYEVTDVALLGSRDKLDDPARFLLASPLHALPFTDSITKLTLARARWLDHETGTFLSPDPLGFVDSANAYAYAGGDPVNRRDP